MQLQTVSFDELKPGSTVQVLMESPPLIYAVELAMVVTGKDQNQAGAVVRTVAADQDLSIKFVDRSLKLPNGTKTIFDELKPGAVVRVLLEQPPLIYAVDLVQVVTGKNSEDAAKALRDLPADLYLPEKISCRSIRLPSGTKKVKFVAYEDALELVMALGGKQATLLQTGFAKTLQRQSAASNVRVSTSKAKCFAGLSSSQVAPKIQQVKLFALPSPFPPRETLRFAATHKSIQIFAWHGSRQSPSTSSSPAPPSECSWSSPL